MIRQWTEFIGRCDVRPHVIFLVDYDMGIAEHLVHGVDVWINTPRRPWEASGTSGMKVLVNGGLNLSELDGWWAEAYAPDVGWALGDGLEHESDPAWDASRGRAALRSARERDHPRVLRPRRAGHPPPLDRPGAGEHGPPDPTVLDQPDDGGLPGTLLPAGSGRLPGAVAADASDSDRGCCRHRDLEGPSRRALGRASASGARRSRPATGPEDLAHVRTRGSPWASYRPTRCG